MDIVSINLTARMAWTDTDEIAPVTNMIDREGEETSDPDEAVTAVIHLPTGQWMAVDLSNYEPVTLQ